MRAFLILLLCCFLAPAFLGVGAARADDDLSGFATGNFNRTREAVEALGTSADPRAASVISALQNGRLYYTPGGAVLIKGDGGSFSDAQTGQAVRDTAGAKPVRLNNAIRSAIDAALGGLRLFDPQAGVRLQAAEAVFKSHDPAALAGLTRALAKEADPAVRRRIEQARAAVILSKSDSSERDKLDAVAVLGARGDADARNILSAVGGSGAVAEAAAAAVASIDRVLRLWSIAQSIYYGISLGSVLLLAAAGLAITFGVMGVINMAHGEMVMLGAYTTFVVQQVMRTHLPGLYGGSLLVAVPMAFLVAGAMGVLIERTLIRWLYGRPLETLLATWGLSLILQQLVRSVFGANNRDVDTPGWMSGAAQWGGGLTLTWNRMYIILFAILVVAALTAALRFTPLGLRMRAVTQNRRMAAAMGIRTPWIDALTFGLGSGVAGIAGVALSQIDNVSPNLGQSYIIDSFMVVVFGGVGNLWGTTLGALTLGIVNKFLEPVAGAVLGKIVVLVLLILFIQRNPRGMFPLKGRAVEA